MKCIEENNESALLRFEVEDTGIGVPADTLERLFAAFEQAMGATAGHKTLIHCAANFRVTAFYALYAHKHLGWTAGQAEAFRARIWAGSDYPVWEAFVARKLAEGREPGES